jgi:NodT family efflux transporter outer membrane factor (OMF) lipoprotein
VIGDAVPAEWTAPGAETLAEAAIRLDGASDPWWTAFGDAELDALVAEALAGSPDLDAAAARLAAAEARARIAGADLWPAVDGGGSASRSRRNFIGFPIPGGDERVLTSINTTYGLSLNVSWEADLWGRVRAGREGALARGDAAAAELAAAALSLTGQTAKSWFGVVEAREQVALAEATLETLSTTTGWVRRRYEAGVREALDLRLARSDEAVARATLAGRQQTLDALERQLQALVGRYPDRSMEGAPETASLGAPPPPCRSPIPICLPSEFVSRRPDLAAAEARLTAAGFDVAAARAALYPRIALTGSYGRSSEELEDLLDNNFTVWSIAGNLVQPIFQGGRLRAGADLARASFEEATALYAGQVLQAFREVETALAADAFLAAREEALASAANEAEEALELANDRYRLGLQGFLTVLEAQRRLYDARSGLLQARRARLDARVDLVLALGGGWGTEAPRADASSP